MDAIPDFEYFSKYASKNVEMFYKKLDDISPEKRYFYNTGFVLSLLLDQVVPNWKQTVFQTDGFLFSKIDNWCH